MPICKSFRLRSLLWALILSVQILVAQNVQVTGIPDVEVWNLVTFALKEQGVSTGEIDFKSNHLVSGYHEYSIGSSQCRNQFDFAFSGGVLKISLKGQEVKKGQEWVKSRQRKVKLEQKQLDEMAKTISLALETYHAQKTMKTKQELVKTNVSILPAENSVFYSLPSIESSKRLVFDDLDHYIFSEGLCAIQRNQLWGFIDTLGNVIIDFRFQNTGYEVPRFRDGICCVCLKTSEDEFEKVCIDKTGSVLFSGKRVKNLTSFSEGISMAEILNADQSTSLKFIDKQGKSLDQAVKPDLSPGETINFRGFSEGLAAVYNSGVHGWGYIDHNARWVLRPESKYTNVGDFHNGLAFVQESTEKKWGAIDVNGQLVIPFMYENRPADFSDGMAAVKDATGKVGYIDTLGTLVVACRYEPVSQDNGLPFSNGFALACKDGQYFSIDTSGEEVKKISRTLMDIRMLKEGLATFKQWQNSGIWAVGLIRTNGDVFREPNVFEKIGEFNSGLAYARATLGGILYCGFINRNGDFVILQELP
jgi:hypothetical protein